MKNIVSLSRSALTLLLAAAALFQACTKNQTEIVVQNLISADCKDQSAALNEAVTLLQNDGSSCISVMEAIINGLKESTDPEDLYRTAYDLAGVSPDFKSKFSSLIGQYRTHKESGDKNAMQTVVRDIQALVAGELSRAECRIADVKAAATDNRALASSVSSHVRELDALPEDAGSLDKYRALTAKTNQLLSSVAGAVTSFYPSGSEYDTSVSAVGDKLGDDFLKKAFAEYTKYASAKQDLIDTRNILEGMVKAYSESGASADVEDRLSEAEEKLKKAGETISNLEDRVTRLETTVGDLVKELSSAGGSMKDYIAAALAEAINSAESDLYKALHHINDRVNEALSRIQSIVYVPDYDDLKITVNSAVVKYSSNALLLDQPTDITYKILPAQYVEDIAKCIKDKEGVSVTFDVKKVKTRSGGEKGGDFSIEILDVVSADKATGEITLKVLPVNIASQSFLDGGLKPLYSSQYSGMVPVWKYEDLMDYQNRSVFAVQLKLHEVLDVEAEQVDGKTVYHFYENEIASTYTTLYPNLLPAIELLPSLYVPGEGPNGSGLKKIDGVEHQYLPYNVFRKDATTAEPGFRTILDGITPAFVIDGKTVSAEKAYELGYLVPGAIKAEKQVKINGKAQGAVITGGKDYIEVEMDSGASESVRKEAIGSTVEGVYTFKTPFGNMESKGVVEICGDTPPGPADSGYDFLHLRYYTFNTVMESASFVQKFNFDSNDGTVEWWTRVNPRYFVDPPRANASPEQNDQRVSFRHALCDYGVCDINLAELAFNIVDKDDQVLTDEEIAKAGLEVKFDYVDQSLRTKALPAECITSWCADYGDLWKSNTTFNFNTKEYPFIKMTASLYKDGKQLPTRFTTPKNSVAYPSVKLDYSSYALVGWAPFEDLESDDLTVTVPSGDIIRVPLLQTVSLMDNRPNGVSYYVIRDGEWVIGNVTEFDPYAGTYSTGGNGYVAGVSAKDAYHFPGEMEFEFQNGGIPADLRKLMKVIYSADGVSFISTPEDGYRPYLAIDMINASFHGRLELSVHVKLRNPWQPDLETDFTVILVGPDNGGSSSGTNSWIGSWRVLRNGSRGDEYDTWEISQSPDGNLLITGIEGSTDQDHTVSATVDDQNNLIIKSQYTGSYEDPVRGHVDLLLSGQYDRNGTTYYTSTEGLTLVTGIMSDDGKTASLRGGVTGSGYEFKNIRFFGRYVEATGTTGSVTFNYGPTPIPQTITRL